MRPSHTMTVTPRIPPSLVRLEDIAYNLRWTWHQDSILLFRRLDDQVWEESRHNPVRMLGMVRQDVLDKAARDDSFIAHMNRTWDSLQTYEKPDQTWYSGLDKVGAEPLVAFFSAEYGITECMSIFAGGLGILSGDYLKSASDLGIPMVGIGLLYQQGYFTQELTNAGWQREIAHQNDFHTLPVRLAFGTDNQPLKIAIELPGRNLWAQVWTATIGRVTLYLLDTNVAENSAEDRVVTKELYGGDVHVRIRQEILLGIGGHRLLETIGRVPTVCHLNEGHSAFVALERARHLMGRLGLTFEEVQPLVTASLTFTTHTPEPAGHDYFAPDIMTQYFRSMADALDIPWADFLALGRSNPLDPAEYFCMTVLAMKMSARTNAVSKLHAAVTRAMWSKVWPGWPEDLIPIGHVTNGVHFRSWISQEMDQLFDRYLSPRWRREPASPEIWDRIDDIPNMELWRTHERRRERLVSFARKRLRTQCERRGMPEREIAASDEVLDPDVLTIAFARRFVPYKRINLLLRDPERLDALVNNPRRPIQIIFAGKAYANDQYGHEMIQQIVNLARQDRFRNRLVFIEGYDMAIARSMLQGTDVWLNNPRRGHEACGTSGMKAMANGAINLSTLDGWWEEASTTFQSAGSPLGWTIGTDEQDANWDRQDQLDSQALYELLEHDIAPAFYDRGRDRLPDAWLNRMKASIRTLAPYFNSHRAVRQYVEEMYIPCASKYTTLLQGAPTNLTAVAAWKRTLITQWPHVAIASVDDAKPKSPMVGDKVSVDAQVQLGSLSTSDVLVQLYSGKVEASGNLVGVDVVPMKPTGDAVKGITPYRACDVPCPHTGVHGYTVCVRAFHPDFNEADLMRYVIWDNKTNVNSA